VTAATRRPAPLGLRALLIVATLGAFGGCAAAWMQVALDCDPAWRSEIRADGSFRVDLCRVAVPLVFPGQGSDAPGYAVLRDAEGWIAGVEHIEILGALDRPAEWTDTGVGFKLSAQFELPARERSLLARVAVDANWRLHTVLGLVRDDSEFR